MINRSQLLLNIRKLYLEYANYRNLIQYLTFKNRVIENVVNVFSKDSIELITFFDDTSYQYSLKSQLIRALRTKRFCFLEKIISIKFLIQISIKQKASASISNMNYSPTEFFNALEHEDRS